MNRRHKVGEITAISLFDLW